MGGAQTQDNSSHTFSFDRLFGTNSEQAEVYDYSAKPLVEALFQGFNGCLLAYGQTGSGKTHTMMGPSMSIEDDGTRGIIPRAVDAIFAEALRADEAMEFSIKASYVESEAGGGAGVGGGKVT